MNLKRRMLLCAILGTVVLLTSSRPTAGQDAPNVTDYIDPASAYHTGDVDSVDVFNHRVALNIPLVVDHSQRGNLNFTYGLRYASTTQWYPVSNGYTWTWYPPNSVISSPFFSMDGDLIVGSSAYDPCGGCPSYATFARDENGAIHFFGTTSGNQGNPPFTAESGDGSGIRADASGSILVNRQGLRFGQIDYAAGSPSYVEDPNGNLLSFSCVDGLWSDCSAFAYTRYMTDTVGRVWTYYRRTSDVSGCPGAPVIADIWDTPGTAGGTRRFKLCYSNIQISTQFNAQYVVENQSTQQLLTAVILPDGTMWQFQYDNYGALLNLYLPTGGIIAYGWTTSYGQHTLNSRARFDGTSWSTWYYNGYTVTDPLGNDTVYTPEAQYTGNSTDCDNRVAQAQYYQGTAGGGNLLKTLSYSYQTLDNPLPGDAGSCAVSSLPISTTTANDLNQQSEVTTVYDHANLDLAFTDDNNGSTHYSVYGLPTQQNVYDWGSGTVGPVLTQDFKWYVAIDLNSDYLAVNNLDLVFEDAFYGTNGNCCFVTYFGIDGSDTVASGVTMQHIAAPSGAIGNVTSIVRYDSTTNSNVTVATYTNYDTGMRATAADALNHTTNYHYANENPNWYGSRLTSATNALGQTVTYAYDWPSGLINWLQDLNGNWTQYICDNMFRPTQINYPDGGQTNFTYSSYNGFMYTLEARKIDNNNRWTSFYTMYDGLGRPFRTTTYDDDSPNYDQVDSCFDALGNVGFRSYPYRSSGFNASPVCSGAEGAGDTFAYDALNRVKQVTHSDGSYTLTSYSGRATSVTDEGNFSYAATRISQVDGLGRITGICEVSNNTQLGTAGTPSACGQDIAGTGFPTTYAYDARNNVTNVSQGGYRNRTFNYDSFSRLTSATNPESGTTNYYYQTSGGAFCAGDLSLPCRRTDARNITTTYVYNDSLNRLTSKTYSDGTPSANYGYDAPGGWGLTLSNTIGRLSGENTYSAAQGYTAKILSYDAMGRTAFEYSCLPAICWSGSGVGYATQSYGYDYVGDLVSAANGEGVTLNYAYNQAQRLTGITSSLNDSNHPGTLFSGAHYNAAGSLTSGTLDGGVINESRCYDGRLRLETIRDTALNNPIYSLTVPLSGYCGYSGVWGYAPDNNIVGAWDSVNGNWSYAYDPFNRLASASKSGQGYTYDYDRFGNRWHQTVTSGSGPQSNLTFAGNNNHIDPGTPGYTYDTAGNLTYDGTRHYFYDAESRVIQVDGAAGNWPSNCPATTACYFYDAEGRRVRKIGGATTDYLYDAGGTQVAAVNGSGAWIRGEVYGGGRHIATYTGGTTGNTYFNFADHLGTERARVTVGGTVCETITSLPFGDGMTINGSCGDPSPMHFTGKERDSESGNDNFGARYDSSQFGRFTTPDPENAGARKSDPQSWNGYAYVLNNPISLTDPNGLDVEVCQTDQDGKKTNCVVFKNDKDYEKYQQQSKDLVFQKDKILAKNSDGSLTQIGTAQHITTQSCCGGQIESANGMNMLMVGPFAGLVTGGMTAAEGAASSTISQVGTETTLETATAGASAYPAEIAGYQVDQHWLERMADLGHRIPSQVVDQVIRYGQTMPSKDSTVLVKFLPGVHDKGVTVAIDIVRGVIIMARIGKP